MSLVERAGLSLLRRVDPERAHTLALRAVRAGLVARPGPVTSDRLLTHVAGMAIPNPIGMAAGFDKNAIAIGPLSRTGFGFLEVGAATPLPQPGNPRPRLFRLTRDGAVINRFGFNNDGAEAIAMRLKTRPASIPVGVNLGANKDSVDRVADYVQVLTTCGPHVDFATVNVSSPNTEGLRGLQGPAALRALLAAVMAARRALPAQIPIFVKIAPDLDRDALTALADVAMETGIDGIIATNTTLARDGLNDPARDQPGGLSGAPLFVPSTQALAQLAIATDGRLPLIGVGGVASGTEAYAKIRAGASAVQLYTALSYHGLSLAGRIARDLDTLLARDGFANVADAVGVDRAAWAEGQPSG